MANPPAPLETARGANPDLGERGSFSLFGAGREEVSPGEARRIIIFQNLLFLLSLSTSQISRM